jgi:hypothetical protein
MPPKYYRKKNKIGSRSNGFGNWFGFGDEQPSSYYKILITYNPDSLKPYRADYVPMDFKRPPLIRDGLYEWDPTISTVPGYIVMLANMKAPNGKTYLGFDTIKGFKRNGLVARAGAPKLRSLKLLGVQEGDDWGFALSDELKPDNPQHPLYDGLINLDMNVLKVDGSDGVFHGKSVYKQKTGKEFFFGGRNNFGAGYDKGVWDRRRSRREHTCTDGKDKFYRLYISYDDKTDLYHLDYIPADHPPLQKLWANLYKWDPIVYTLDGYEVKPMHIEINGQQVVGINSLTSLPPRIKSTTNIKEIKPAPDGTTKYLIFKPKDSKHLIERDVEPIVMPLSGNENKQITYLRVGCSDFLATFMTADEYKAAKAASGFGRRRRSGGGSIKSVMADIKYLRGC